MAMLRTKLMVNSAKLWGTQKGALLRSSAHSTQAARIYHEFPESAKQRMMFGHVERLVVWSCLVFVRYHSSVGAPHSEDVGSAVSNVIDDYRPRNLVWEGGTHGYGHWPLPLIGRKGLRRLDFCWDARFSGCYILDFGCVFTAKKWYTEHMEISRL